MSWGGGWGRGRRGWIGPWPGRGPFSFLPPWQRPGWLFGRGSCWWLFGGPWAFYRFPFYGGYWPPSYHPYYYNPYHWPPSPWVWRYAWMFPYW